MDTKRTLSLFLLVFLALAPGILYAQRTPRTEISGVVYDAETEAPLPGVHVFIESTTLGTATANDGRFTLKRIPLGSHQLVITMIGYETQTTPLRLTGTALAGLDVRLTPAVIEMQELVVVEERPRPPRRWRRQLRRFTREFIGRSENARDCRILNPDVLRFSQRYQWFSAKADDPLLIENRALGYRIRFYLDEFIIDNGRIRYKGPVHFEPLEPADEAEQARWAAERLRAYNGSLRHFLATLADASERVQLRQEWLAQQGFKLDFHYAKEGVMYLEKYKPSVDPGDLVAEAETAFERTLFWEDFDYLNVVYTGELEEEDYVVQTLGRRRAWVHNPYFPMEPTHQITWLQLEGAPAVFTLDGLLDDPYALTMSGYMGWERFADRLPDDYQPPPDEPGF